MFAGTLGCEKARLPNAECRFRRRRRGRSWRRFGAARIQAFAFDPDQSGTIVSYAASWCDETYFGTVKIQIPQCMTYSALPISLIRLVIELSAADRSLLTLLQHQFHDIAESLVTVYFAIVDDGSDVEFNAR